MEDSVVWPAFRECCRRNNGWMVDLFQCPPVVSFRRDSVEFVERGNMLNYSTQELRTQ